MKLTKEECLELGKQYVLKYNCYPTAKGWNISSAGCSRDRIYENWNSWVTFIKELKEVITVPETKKNTVHYQDFELINYIHKSAFDNAGFPKYSDFKTKNYPSITTLKERFGSWSNAITKAGYNKVYKYETTGKELSLLEALNICFNKYNYKIPKNTKGIDKDKLLVFLASRQSTKCGALGYSSQGWTYFISKVFPDKPKNTNYYDWLLYKEGFKFCPCCNKVKILSNFWKNSKTYTKYNSYCASCMKPLNAAAQKSIQANRRASKLRATPAWADFDKIKSIYDNCPTGYHVDHIIPLQGKYICGLHVETNLQYLPASENISKRNYHESENC